ncbi:MULTISPECIES: CDP-glycerol glycerophosphotransferase family protein [unclassified Aeromicrobium]|uniref:CDP-glycerol glycerophosphotransferase family protein n=1 Tax=unclassified Aeromicrobium TaxID=2633570 RepID=UPI0006FB2627|nr:MULTISPECIES: CDP-glycerol glycerophosphotransferase family protein [unclassified Aeromicrobium]KQP26076.1 hypothetical protein ASF38_10525 [Aeromicrobium sp. Leaf272]KQP75323.1 hypothetical protein ASF37_15840 [Aeromicrobium sp. Leaf289]
MSGARAGLAVRVRLWLIGRIRRSRFLPTGMPDKRVDVAALEQPLAADVIVFHPTGQDTLYQLLPWLPAFRALGTTHPVTIVFRDSRTAAAVRTALAESGDDAGVTCLTLATYGQLDAILSRSRVRLALYVNHDPINFECLRFTSLAHVYLGHGDSDKGVSVSNQVKAYDHCFLAGRAALERTATHVMDYDAEERSILIGQPQLDGSPDVVPAPDPAGRPTVLYAPTWEASQPSVSYGSVDALGLELVRALQPTYRVVYRPHPLNGVVRAEYGAADAAVREAADRVDLRVPLEQSFADADLLVTDVSAVPLNWLPTGKPMLVTVPGVPTPASRMLELLPRVRRGDDHAALVAHHLADDPTRQARTALVSHYLTDVTPGAATQRFVDACEQVMARRDRLWAEKQALGATGP